MQQNSTGAAPELATTKTNKAMKAALAGMEKREMSEGVNEAESALLDWLATGGGPECHFNSPEVVLDALEPTSGGSTLERVNLYRRAWWISLRRLQKRLKEFAALDIAEPPVLTQVDIEAIKAARLARFTDRAATLPADLMGDLEGHLDALKAKARAREDRFARADIATKGDVA